MRTKDAVSQAARYIPAMSSFGSFGKTGRHPIMPARRPIEGRTMEKIPTVLNDQYEIEERIGHGGMGSVYRARDRHDRTGQRVAIKVMREEAGPRGLELFNQEWKILAELQHPFIVRLLGCGEFSDGATVRPFFVMPFLRGRTLQDLIRKQSTLPLEQVLEIVCCMK